MSGHSLPQNVGRLLDRYIYSVSQLETLLLLLRYKERCWTAHEIANELHSNDAAALEVLTRLAAAELIVKSSGATSDEFRYNPLPNLEADLQALAKAYKQVRMRVVDRIYTKPTEESSFQSIADSFLWRKDES